MKQLYVPVRYMTPEETAHHQLMNPGLMMEYGHLTIPLNAGYRDRVSVFRQSNSLFILTTNRPLCYAGLDEIDCLDGQVIGSVFLDEHQLKEHISKQWMLMKPETLIRKMSGYL